MENPRIKKGLGATVVLLFLSTTCIPVLASEGQPDLIIINMGFTPYGDICNQSDDCYPLFKGTPGRHGWFVSPLIVTFIFNPENVTEIQSWLNESWVPYDGPFNITEKGELPLFKWRYRTIESGSEWIYDQCHCPFKTDFDQPSVNINIQRKGFLFWKKYIVTVDAIDSMSGMDYVEFYLNGELQFNDTVFLYQWTLKPVPRGQNLTFKVVAYDFAGNSNDDQVLKPNVYSNCLLSKGVGHAKLYGIL